MKQLIACMLGLLAAFTVASVRLSDAPPDKGVVAVAFAGFIVPFIGWLIVSHVQRMGNWFHPVILFTGSYFLVFYQIPIQEAFGWGLLIEAAAAPELTNVGCLYATCGYISFLIGWTALGILKKVPNRALLPIDAIKRVSQTAISAVPLLTAMATSTFLVFAALAGPPFYIEFLYDGGLSWGSGATYAYAIWFPLNFLVIALDGGRSALISRNFVQYLSTLGLTTKIYISVITTPFLLSGDRGVVLAILFALVTPYALLVKPFKLGYGLLAFAGLALFTVAGRVWRTRFTGTTIGERASNVLASLSDGDLLLEIGPTRELAHSYYVFNATLDIFPSQFPYSSGKFLASSAASAIPFLERFLGGANTANSAVFLTDYLNKGDMSSGVGTACLNAPYMDFGLPGIIAIMAVFGLFVSWIFNLISTPSQKWPLYLALNCFMSFQFLKIPRSDAFFMLQNLLWIGLAYFAFVFPFRGRASKL